MNIQVEIDKLHKFNSDQSKIVSKFCSFINYRNEPSYYIPSENNECMGESTFKFLCGRKKLLRFIHPDRISELQLELEEENKIKQCTIEIVSNKLNIIDSLKLVKNKSSNGTFLLICAKLKLKQEHINRITPGIDNTIPQIPILLQTYIDLHSNTASLKSKIVGIINSVFFDFNVQINRVWSEIYTKNFSCKPIYLCNDEKSKMEREDYHIEIQIYNYYLNNNMNLSYGELAKMVNKDSLNLQFKSLLDSTPYLYEYIYNYKIGCSYSNHYLNGNSDINAIAELEFDRFNSLSI